MDLLRANLSQVNTPSPSSKVFKEECCVSYDTPRSPGGLFIDLTSFLAFGRDYVQWNYEKTGHKVYLNLVKTPKPPPEEEQPRKKPMLLAIGVEGGYQEKDAEYEESFKIVILPEFVELQYPDVNLPEKVRLAVTAVLAAQGAERRDALTAWAAEKKKVSSVALSLVQQDNGVKVPHSGWQCAFCDKRENLWLNLTDGTILCGRRNWDGTGGNNHAVEYFSNTNYPLAVKLGTITADLTQADVFSYAEDDSVEDPLLAQHLAHFGIDFTALQKTESTTAELELDANLSFDFSRIQEAGKNLQPLFGPGYTGLANLGNSCYLASVMQAVLSTDQFQKRYFEALPLKDAFQQAPADPTVDFTAQMAKLAAGVFSGRYSQPLEEGTQPASSEEPSQPGIFPRMFKSVVGHGHPEFSSGRQQDALEFFQHLLELVEKAAPPNNDPSKAFRFRLQERIQCAASSKVKYTERLDNVLSLPIPLDKAVNKEEVVAFEKRKAEKTAAGEKLDSSDVVRPRVPLAACLESFASTEEVADFYSSAIKAKTTALKSTRLSSFPDYLVLHMRKFVHDKGWVPRKLDVFVDVPEELDISSLRGQGKQSGEEDLPEDDHGGGEAAGPSPDAAVVSALEDMGFPHVRCEKAAVKTQNAGVEEAMNWLLQHMEDPDIDAPLSSSGRGGGSTPVDEGAVQTLMAFGFNASQARRALKETVSTRQLRGWDHEGCPLGVAMIVQGGNIEAAAEWIFAHPDAGEEAPMEEDKATATMPDLPDGPGKYSLLAFVSHIGSSTHAGHYVCHVKKDGKWVIFNDNKVAASGDPPKDMGYLYFYKRL